MVFCIIMVFTLIANAAAPYQTYTYSIDGTALYSPDAYVPYKSVDSDAIGLSDPVFMSNFYPELKPFLGLSTADLNKALTALGRIQSGMRRE